ncbi:MAG: nuclear transport factor 2 family protein [Pseudomonadota bacterium]
MRLKSALPLAAALAFNLSPASASPEDDKRIVAEIDTAYQAAVEINDAETMAKILHEDFTLVVGAGAVFTREDLLRLAREKEFIYEKQVEEEGTQTVRLYGADTAIVTALLWLKGVHGETAFDKRLWFSDTYVRTKDGWRYAFGQASIALPPETAN